MRPAACLTVLALAGGQVAVADCPRFAGPAVSGTIAVAEITEASGLAASRANGDVLWVHNDSGDQPRLFAVRMDGRLAGIFRLEGARAVDWEDIAIGPGPVGGAAYIYVGDIGDNARVRPAISVYRVSEPVLPERALGAPVDTHFAAAVPPWTPTRAAVPPWTPTSQGQPASWTPVGRGQAPLAGGAHPLTGVEEFRMRYPDGPHDAETLLVDPTTGDLFVVTKDRGSPVGRVFRYPAPPRSGTVALLEEVARVEWGGNSVGETLATGGDISPDGTEIVIRTYLGARLWRRALGESVGKALTRPGCPIPVAVDVQGEAIAFLADGSAYVTVSEGKGVPIYRFDRVQSGSRRPGGTRTRPPAGTSGPTALWTGVGVRRAGQGHGCPAGVYPPAARKRTLHLLIGPDRSRVSYTMAAGALGGPHCGASVARWLASSSLCVTTRSR